MLSNIPLSLSLFLSHARRKITWRLEKKGLKRREALPPRFPRDEIALGLMPRNYRCKERLRVERAERCASEQGTKVEHASARAASSIKSGHNSHRWYIRISLRQILIREASRVLSHREFPLLSSGHGRIDINNINNNAWLEFFVGTDEKLNPEGLPPFNYFPLYYLYYALKSRLRVLRLPPRRILLFYGRFRYQSDSDRQFPSRCDATFHFA